MGDLLARPLVVELVGHMSHSNGAVVPRQASVRLECWAEDPAAIRGQFRDAVSSADWVFGRDLLVGPLIGATAKDPSLRFGHGDVVTRWQAQGLVVVLRNLGDTATGEASFLVPAGPVEGLVVESLRRVPLTAEAPVYAGLVDSAVAQILTES